MTRQDFPADARPLVSRLIDEVRHICPDIVENDAPKDYVGLDYPHSVVPRQKLVCGIYRTSTGFSVSVWNSPAGRGGRGDRWPTTRIRSSSDWKPLLPLMKARVEWLRTGVVPGK